jgi:acyl-CoA synthetase (AMP-forming)/AMP-acid ligase II
VSLCGLLRAGLDANPDGLALIFTDTRWTWRTLDDLSDRLAVSLLGLGLRPGDRVASLMPNRPALIVHYLACWKAGLVATPLNYRYKAPEIDHALAVSEARAILAHVDREEDLAASQLVRKLPLGTISYGGEQGAGPSFGELVEEEASSSPPPPPSPAPGAMISPRCGCAARGATPSRRRCSRSSPR